MASFWENLLKKQPLSPEVAPQRDFLSELLQPQAAPTPIVPNYLPELKAQPLNLEPAMQVPVPMPVDSRTIPQQIEDEAADLAEKYDTEETMPELEPSEPQVYQETTPKLGALEEAQSRSSDLLGLLMMSRGAEKIGSALARTKSDPEYLKELEQNIDRPIKNVLQKQNFEGNALDNILKQQGLTQAQQLSNPNSTVSNIYRETARSMVQNSPTLQKNEQLVALLEGDVSASDLQRFSPMLFNLISQEQARAARIEAARELAKTKEDKAKESKEAAKLGQELKLSDRISKADRETGFSASRAAYHSLNNMLKSGQWDSTMDIEMLYRFIKLLDPESVVREGEIQLARQGESVIGMITKQPGRITKGDILSKDFRNKLTKAVQRHYNLSKKEFEDRIAPFKKQAESHELKWDNIINENILYPESQPEDEQIVIREKTTGKMKRLPKDKATEILKDSNYEQVR